MSEIDFDEFIKKHPDYEKHIMTSEEIGKKLNESENQLKDIKKPINN